MWNFQRKKCHVLGLGISNRPLVDFLLKNGACVTVHDQKEIYDIPDAWKSVTFVTGDGYLSDLSGDYIFRTPGIRPDLPEICRAINEGAVLTSEMECFLQNTKAKVFAVTGSDGKTTTTTITAKLLEEKCKRTGKGRVFLGGNIGTPLLPYLDEMTEEDYAVVELSSFQLSSMRFSVPYSAVTNLSENHLNWHTDMAEYLSAKCNIFRYPQNKRIVLNAENAYTNSVLPLVKKENLLLFSSKEDAKTDAYLSDGIIYVRRADNAIPFLALSDIQIPGMHNVENYMTALALVFDEILPEDAKAVAENFYGVAHRLETVAVVDGVKYINSSIDSTPTRTIHALSALTENPIILCGGYDKHLSYDELAQVLQRKAKRIVLFGQSAGLIASALQNACVTVPYCIISDFSDAVLYAHSVAKSGDTVLLSPACASFDAFRNFEERGECFRSLVKSFETKLP